MSKQIILTIVEVVCFAILATLTYFIFTKDVDFGAFQLMKVDTIQSEIADIATSKISAEEAIASYSTESTELEAAKKNFEEAKQDYNKISEDTIDIIRKAYMEEKYSIEYIWIRLGMYAEANDLKIALVEPGGNKNDVGESSDEISDPNGSAVSGTPAEVLLDDDDTPELNLGVEAPEDKTGREQLEIYVEGSYLDVADFVFNVENDESLHFKLDNIKMEYKGDNKISASFIINQLEIFK